MDAKFQPTYMPKLPISAVPRPVINISVLYVVAVIMFIVVLGLVIGVYIYEHFLNQDIERLNGELVTARDSFELSTIAELKRTAAFTDIALGLLDRHVAVSNFFSYLQESTYINTAFSGLILTTTIHRPRPYRLPANREAITPRFCRPSIFLKTRRF